MNPSLSSGSQIPRTLSRVQPLPPMSQTHKTWRKTKDIAMRGLCAFATILAVIPLFLVLYYVTVQGLKVMNIEFFTQIQRPAGDMGGGLKQSIVGTMMMVGLACCIGLPVGILGGIYLSEFGQNRFGFWVRFATDVLNGVPSIIMGVFVYTIAVLPVAKATADWDEPIRYSAWAGGLALGIMMVPTIMRTTEEIVRLVPQSLREGALALGDTRWHSTFKIVLATAKGGVVTGVLLAIARIAGETAPLIFTAGSSLYFNLNPNNQTDSLPYRIFISATSPDDRWQALAWGGAFVLVAMIFILSLLARYATRTRQF